MRRTDLVQGLDLPRGWLWDDWQPMNGTGGAVVTWPRIELSLVIVDEKREQRRALASRFQLFDVKGGGYAKIAASENLSDILTVFDSVRASR